MKRTKLIMLFIMALAITAFGQQQGNYSKEAGYFDFGNILSLKSGETITEIYLEEPLLKMVAQMGDAKDEELGNLIGGLKLVKVNEFMMDQKDIKKIDDSFNSINQNLQSNNWNRIIKTKRHEALANVYIKNGNKNDFAGLVITSVDKKGKVTLVNIVGSINPSTLGKLSQHFHFPNVDKMKEKEKED